ncbi:hypothetical protein ACTMU2_37920 [Cupriavidus basilensis]
MPASLPARAQTDAGRSQPRRAGTLNLPAWWLRMLREAYPDQWMALAESANVRPPMTLRVNTARIPLQQYLTELANAGLAGQAVGAQAVRLVRAFLGRAQIPGFADGDVSVQDAGARAGRAAARGN